MVFQVIGCCARMRKRKPGRLVAVDSDAATYTVDQGVTRLPHIEHVPWLDVVAAKGASPDRLILFCVNRNLTRDYHAMIQVDGFAPASLAQVKTIAAPSIYTVNSDYGATSRESLGPANPGGLEVRYGLSAYQRGSHRAWTEA